MSAEVASQGSAQQPCYRKQRCDSSFATSILRDNWGEARSQPNPRQMQNEEHLQAWVRAAWAQILPGKGKKLMRGRDPATSSKCRWCPASDTSLPPDLWEKLQGELCEKCGRSREFTGAWKYIFFGKSEKEKALAGSPSWFIAEPKPVIKLKNRRKRKDMRSIKKWENMKSVTMKVNYELGKVENL